MKDPGGFAGDRADEHRDILISSIMADRNISPKQGFSKEKLHPKRKLTKSGFQRPLISLTVFWSCPLW